MNSPGAQLVAVSAPYGLRKWHVIGCGFDLAAGKTHFQKNTG
jgi:hypothetical protein